MKILVLVSIIGIIEALHCDKEFNYYDNYGHGFDVKCEGITEQHLHLLSNITIHNEISLTIDNSFLNNVSSDIFHNVHLLRCLYIENSTFTYPHDHQIFRLLQNLEHLVVTNTPFLINKNTFIGLESVQELVLSNNSISKIEPDSFKSLTKLRHLKINFNKIQNVMDLPLCEMRDLRILNLSLNIIKDLQDQTFYCKRNVPHMNLVLNNHDVTVNVEPKDFSTVADYALELTHLDLSYNKITDLGTALTDLKSLTVLKLEGNFLRYINNSNLKDLDELEELYLKNNNLEKVGDKIFSYKQNLEILDFSHNKLKDFSIAEVPILNRLNLGYNRINSIAFLKSATLKNLQILILCNNNINTIDSSVFKNFPVLNTLHLQSNRLKLKNDSFTGLSELRVLLLSNNSLEILPTNVFKDLKNLHTLDLSQNKLKHLDQTEIFQSLIELEVLNISFNLIENLNYNILQPLEDLRVLDIAGNKLKSIQYDLILSNLRLLTVLNIKANLLSCELLYEVIQFLKNKSVSYSVAEKFNYDKENVGGIYCTSEKITNKTTGSSSSYQNDSVLYDLTVAVVVIMSLMALGLGFFKFHIYLKRRRYRADEFELIHE